MAVEPWPMDAGSTATRSRLPCCSSCFSPSRLPVCSLTALIPRRLPMIVLLTWLCAWSTTPMLTLGVPLPKLIKPKIPMIISGTSRLKKIAPRLRKYAFSDDQVSMTKGLRVTSAFAQPVPGHVEEDVLEIGRALHPILVKPLVEQPLDQGIGGLHGQDLSVVHDRHPVAQRFGLIHVVRGEHDGPTFRPNRFRQLPQVASSLGIQPGGGFVEEEDLGLVDERGRDTEALLLSARQLGYRRARLLGQVHLLQDRHGIDRAVVERAEHVEQLEQVQAIEEGRGLELHPDQVLHFLRVLADVDAGDDRLAVVRTAQALEDLDRRRLAGTIGAEQSEDLALLDPERDAVNRHQAPVPFSQSVDDDREPLGLGAKTGISWSGDHAHARDIIAAVAVASVFSKITICSPGTKPSSRLIASIPALSARLSVCTRVIRFSVA